MQRAWLAKPENRNYFRDTGNAERVRNWQKVHPGYWKNTMRYSGAVPYKTAVNHTYLQGKQLRRSQL